MADSHRVSVPATKNMLFVIRGLIKNLDRYSELQFQERRVNPEDPMEVYALEQRRQLLERARQGLKQARQALRTAVDNGFVKPQ